MDFEVIGRRVDITPEVRDFLAKRVEKLRRLFDRTHALKVVLVAEGSVHTAEFVAHLVKSDTVVSKGSDADLYTAIEVASDRLEHQLRKYKEKLRDHRPRSEEQGGEEVPPKS